MSVEWQHWVCQELGLRFVRANKCIAGGPDVSPDVRLNHPASVKKTKQWAMVIVCSVPYAIS